MKLNDIIIVGYPASGKTYLARIFETVYGYKTIEIGDLVRQESSEQGLNSYDCVSNYFDKKDYCHFVSIALKKKMNDTNNHYVYVGVRRVEELYYLLQHLANPVTIGMIADYDTRN